MVLLERKRLTSGTTWHAAGEVVSDATTTEDALWMARYSAELYARLEEDGALHRIPPVRLSQACHDATRPTRGLSPRDGVHALSGDDQEVLSRARWPTWCR